jgi:hypothetical protein
MANTAAVASRTLSDAAPAPMRPLMPTGFTGPTGFAGGASRQRSPAHDAVPARAPLPAPARAKPASPKAGLKAGALKRLKSRFALPFRAPAVVYIQQDMYLLRRRRWFRSTEALEQYIKETVAKKAP